MTTLTFGGDRRWLASRPKSRVEAYAEKRSRTNERFGHDAQARPRTYGAPDIRSRRRPRIRPIFHRNRVHSDVRRREYRPGQERYMRFDDDST